MSGQVVVSMQQTIEIIKALSMNAKILIMDEPTSALSKTEIDKLFEIVSRLKQQGVAIIYITQIRRIAVYLRPHNYNA